MSIWDDDRKKQLKENKWIIVVAFILYATLIFVMWKEHITDNVPSFTAPEIKTNEGHNTDIDDRAPNTDDTDGSPETDGNDIGPNTN